MSGTALPRADVWRQEGAVPAAGATSGRRRLAQPKPRGRRSGSLGISGMLRRPWLRAGAAVPGGPDGR